MRSARASARWWIGVGGIGAIVVGIALLAIGLFVLIG
jgi:hypothetical protein